MRNYIAKQRDLELILRSHVPIVVIETREESRSSGVGPTAEPSLVIDRADLT